MVNNTNVDEEKFINRIERLDAGKLAMLRRGCGARDPVEGRCPWLIELVHGVSSEPVAFLVASLLAQYKTADIKAGNHRIKGNFGLTWRYAVQRTDSESIKRRFHILLESYYDPYSGDGDLPYRLRQMIRYSSGKNIGVDWPRLLADLKYWNNPEKTVQKNWARNFFSNIPEQNEQNSLNEKE
ncbi:MAG: type I-E CRISPR-associated protein Cse2/CasB [Dehalococcoidales bacterium]|nr:type I-E CRISPR-associated protein Cse2/CasB [Dehalococcoidales bacterium]